MAARTIAIPVTTDASGDVTTTRIGVHGEVLAVGVNIGSGGTALAGTTDITITDDLTDATIATFANVAADVRRQPKVVPTQPDGTALTTAGPAVSPVLTGRIRVVVAQGGATKSGTVYVVLA